MKCMLMYFLALLTAYGQTQTGFAQQPMLKGFCTYNNGKPEAVIFDYGTELTGRDITQLSALESIVQVSFGYAGVDSEYVTIEGKLNNLGRLKNLAQVHLNKDGIVDGDLRFIASLPKIHELEFNAVNGDGGCTDRCADHLSKAKAMRVLRIHNGNFTDDFVDRITKGLPELQQLMLSSPELTDESLRLIAERCKSLKSLSIGSDQFTSGGLDHLNKLKNLRKCSVRSPHLREGRTRRSSRGSVIIEFHRLLRRPS